MTIDEKTEALTEARMFALAAPVILPLIEKRKKYATEKLQSKFREGGTDFTTLVAEITCLADLEREIKQKESIYNTMMERHT